MSTADSTLFELITATVNTTGLDDHEHAMLSEAIAVAVTLLGSSPMTGAQRVDNTLALTPRQVLDKAAQIMCAVAPNDDEHAMHLRKVGDAISRALRPVSSATPVPAVSAGVLPESTVSWVTCPTCGYDTIATEELCEQCGNAVPLKEETTS